MTSHLVYHVALWDYLGENLDFNMDRIVIMREEYLKKRHSNILIYRPQISFFQSLSLSVLTRFPVLSFLYVFHCLINL